MKILTVAMCIGLLVCVPVAQAQFDDYGRWEYHENFEPAHFTYAGYTEAEAEELREWWNHIGEISDGGAWRGDFFRPFGDLGTTILRLDPSQGYVRLTTHSCRPDVRRFDYGRVEESDDAVRIVPEGRSGAVTTLLKVTWGDRQYLVEEDEIEAFCESASGVRVLARGEEYEASGYFRNEGGADTPDTPVSGTPTVPEPYARYVTAPITGRVVGVTVRKREAVSTVYRMRFDRGTADGLRKRMMVHFVEANILRNVIIERVGANWAEATVRVYDNDESDSPEPPAIPTVGLAFTTCGSCVP